jgi:hypothetical protein
MGKVLLFRSLWSVLLAGILIMSGCTAPVSTATQMGATQTPPTTASIHASTAMTPETDVISGTLFANPDNPRYFTDGTIENGKYRAVYLTGSHTWCNFTDCGNTNPPPVFDYAEYLDFLETYNHNFFRLWRAENARGGEGGDDFWFYPLPYQRSPAECCAFDGDDKFDLEKFDQSYFDRLRERVVQAGERDIYVSIMLFDGWSVENKFPDTHQPWKGHPFNINNNVNDVNGDLDGNGQGKETHTLAIPRVTALQEEYIRKVVDTVNDLDNVLYEVSNESSGDSKDWQYHLINFIKEYEAAKPKQHPVGMTVAWPNGSNADVYNSPADWVSFNGDPSNPPIADGMKVVLADTDHLCGICGDRQWVWKSFTRGENPIFMDYYDNAVSGRGIPFENPHQEEIRVNLGYVRNYAERMKLEDMLPLVDLCSTSYCLANPATDGAEYLVFLPVGGTVAGILNLWDPDRKITLNLSADSTVKVDLTKSPGLLSVEWFNPQDGSFVDDGSVQGGSHQTFVAPFSGDAVLYIYDNQP